MILFWFIIFLIFSGLVAWIAGKAGKNAPRWVALISLMIGSAVMIVLWAGNYNNAEALDNGKWMIDYKP
ncbi:MAG TPA: hypothetical protein VE870_09300, partial [Bacteroidales bacterium]|nr:hypothetical protein [Bacteroidales bacterium]